MVQARVRVRIRVRIRVGVRVRVMPPLHGWKKPLNSGRTPATLGRD